MPNQHVIPYGRQIAMDSSVNAGGNAFGARHVGGEFVVSAAEVLHECVPRDDHLCGPVCL